MKYLVMFYYPRTEKLPKRKQFFFFETKEELDEYMKHQIDRTYIMFDVRISGGCIFIRNMTKDGKIETVSQYSWELFNENI